MAAQKADDRVAKLEKRVQVLEARTASSKVIGGPNCMCARHRRELMRVRKTTLTRRTR